MTDLRSVYTPLGGLALLFLFLTFVIPAAAPVFALVGTSLLVAAVTVFLVGKRSARYDLDVLREMHESGGPVPEDDLPEVADDAGVVCPCCGNVYAAWLLVCPRCKR